MNTNHSNPKDWLQRIDAEFSELDSDTCMHLRSINSTYDKLCKQSIKLQTDYPVVVQIVEMGRKAVGTLTLSEEEHKALMKCLDVRNEMARMERKHLYFQGHKDNYAYLTKIVGLRID